MNEIVLIALRRPYTFVVMSILIVLLGTITVLHIAVSEDYSSQGRHHKQMMVPLFIGKLREIGRQIKGVAMLRLLYDTEFRDIPV